MEKLILETANLADEKYNKLLELFPNIATEIIDSDGNLVRAIDKDILTQIINRFVVEGRQERYQFTWPGKKASIALANTPIKQSIRLNVEKSIGKKGSKGNIDSHNIYIEGDNLYALKSLREAYLGKVKMIYIDPPYNTGKNFIYKDSYRIDKNLYKEDGSYDIDGNILVQNFNSEGRFHSNWLNMIYPRLLVARDLLADEGVIFISIDDNELSNLKKVCDEIFGAVNFVAVINWKGRGGRQDSKYFAAVHEYILCYAKSKQEFIPGEEIKSGDIYPKYDENQKRFYKTQLLRKWGSNSRRIDRPNLFYPIIAPDGEKVFPIVKDKRTNSSYEGCWRHGKNTMSQNLKNGKIEFVKQADGSWVPYEKIFAPKIGEEKTKKYTTWIEQVNDGSDVIKRIFGKVLFDYPKGPSLIKHFFRMANIGSDDIILDFFSGSGTVAQAVMEYNLENNTNNKFILIQLPDTIENNEAAIVEGYNNICELAEERIKRVGEQILSNKPNISLDIGMRTFFMDTENKKDVECAVNEYNQVSLDFFSDNIKADRTSLDLTIDVLLVLGLRLSSEIRNFDESLKNTFSVADNYLITCFEEPVTEEMVKSIALKKPVYAVFKDISFIEDSILTNIEQIFNTYSPETKRMVI